jgi:WXXGXW repeat (2 copies)
MGRLASTLAALAAALCVAGCVVTPANPYPAPPPLQAEVVPTPAVGQVWEPGHWQWNGVQYAWVPGRYIAQAPGVTHWVHGRWVLQGGAWVWVPGHWV